MKKESMCLLFYCVMTLALGLTMGQTRSNTTTTTSNGNQTSTHLNIAVPYRPGFSDFVKVTTDPNTGERIITGFAVEVFKAVADKSLPKSYSYGFILYPLSKADGTSNASFDTILQEINSNLYDGIAGDVSIVSYRTSWVDFTFPYLDTGISMLVPIPQQNTKKSTHIRLSKVTNGFVAATLAFSLIVAISFWVKAYIANKYASQSQSSDPNSQYEIQRSIRQTRLVVVLFFMVLLVLNACYTASQTSSLSVTRKKSPTKNLNQLIRTGAKVGYQQGSFIKSLLIDRGFLESNLIAFDTNNEMFELLSNGGVSVVIGLTPHLSLRQAGRCNSLTLVSTFNLRAAGFGFAFRKGSPIVNDMSDGILKAIYNRQIANIQDRTIGNLDTCPDGQNGEDSSEFINTDTLGILVGGAIVVVILMLIMLLVHFNKTAYPCHLLPCS